VHGKDVISKKELALLYLLIYITIALFGAGRFSLDNVLGGGSKRRR
jgi:putative oxidoreductase